MQLMQSALKIWARPMTQDPNTELKVRMLQPDVSNLYDRRLENEW